MNQITKFPIVLAFLLIAGCVNKKSTPPIVTNDSVAKRGSTNDASALTDTTCHRIIDSDVIQLMVNFLSHRDLDSIARHCAIGGTFDLNNIYEEAGITNYIGKAFFMCNNIYEKNATYPATLFCAFQEGMYDTGSLPVIKIVNNETVTPNADNIIKYTGTDNSSKSVQKFLDTRVPYSGFDKVTPADSLATIRSLAEDQFVNHFPIKDKTNPYSKISAAFFMTEFVDKIGDSVVNTDIKDFYTQHGIKNVRYYFGYRNDTTYNDYNITIILMSVDSNGKSMMGANNIILEKSWPPGGN